MIFANIIMEINFFLSSTNPFNAIYVIGNPIIIVNKVKNMFIFHIHPSLYLKYFSSLINIS